MRRPVQEMQDCDTVTPRLPSPAAADAFETYPRTSRDDRIARLNRASEALVNISRDRLHQHRIGRAYRHAAFKVLSALATGCTCILKPSEDTPLSDNCLTMC